jgi:hypothetical protein
MAACLQSTRFHMNGDSHSQSVWMKRETQKANELKNAGATPE